ncbi:hypothetical protein PRIPAC_82189 [Pristionchus pacificus]|uniref:Uncharacterized protein n=1 Tax=Pristionchus pacificus TaxID=54126 RepID=A0A2A6BH47_PRIPA|nr:hypothetical protein PRIPAC_82189 [Pristionchus pacificus]|eukprot:PDM65245.1 hypothetical protein PRIPAC_52187 [Pristionchus pacificus]
MRTSRICCCSATTVSIVLSFVGALMNAWPAINAWWFEQNEYLTIWQNALIVILLISSGIIFAAVFGKIPELMYISILAQFLAIVTILGDGIYYMAYFGAYTDNQTQVSISQYLYSMYVISFLVSIVVLLFHMCAQKQLFEQKYRANKQPSIESTPASAEAKPQQQASPVQQQPPPQPAINQQHQQLQPQYLLEQYPPQQQFQPQQFQQFPPQQYPYQPQQYMPHAKLATAAGPPVRAAQPQQQYQLQLQPQPAQAQSPKSQQQAGKETSLITSF